MKDSAFRKNLYMLRELWRIHPARVILTFVATLCDYAVGVFVSLVFMRYIFGSASVVREFSDIVWFVGISMVGLAVTSGFSQWFNKRYRPMTDAVIAYRFNMKIFEKAANVDIACYENPEFYDSYTMAAQQAETRALEVLDCMCGIVAALLSGAFVVGTIFTLDWIAALVSAIPFISSIIFNRHLNAVEHSFFVSDNHASRQRNYFSRVMFLRKYTKEIRLSNIFSVLKKYYNGAYAETCGNVDRVKHKWFGLAIAHTLICYPLMDAFKIYFAWRVLVAGTLGVGEFVVLTAAMATVSGMLQNLADSFADASRNGLYITQFLHFMDYEVKIPEDQDGLMPPTENLELTLHDVGFTYDGAEEPVLHGINLSFRSGETVALLGHNGAGKSTLIKLLLRLYDPTEGEIRLNGIDIRQYNLRAYRNLFSTVFQDFAILAMTLMENVMMRESDDPAAVALCREALERSGLWEKIEGLENNLHSMMTREFDDKGVVLSGGENQKLAIARAVAKDAAATILDEPSSALDPIAEYEMYERLTALYEKKNNLVVLISHRLSCALLADCVVLLDEGRVAEEGAHHALMAREGKYAALFNLQAQSYLEGVDEDEE